MYHEFTLLFAKIQPNINITIVPGTSRESHSSAALTALKQHLQSGLDSKKKNRWLPEKIQFFSVYIFATLHMLDVLFI